MNKHSKRLLTLATLVTTTTATIHIINKVIAASACLKEMLILMSEIIIIGVSAIFIIPKKVKEARFF